MIKPLYNKDGSTSPQGFAIGYVDDSHGGGTRIEKHHLAYLARADDGHTVLYHGPSLTAARKACKAFIQSQVTRAE